jgi:hypothetical protein
MSEKSTHPDEVRSCPKLDDASETQPAEVRPWWTQPVVKVLLWSAAVTFVLFAVITVLMLIVAFTTTNWMAQDFDTFTRMDALQAAGVFGRGANGQLIAGVRAVTSALKDNLLGFVGATIVLVVIGLAVAHIVGDQRAQEKTAKLVQGVLMLAAATGLVA